MHVWLPASKVLEFKAAATKIMNDSRVGILEYGLWGPELFSITVESQGKKAAQRIFQALDSAMKLAQDLGGSMEYCHGVGIRLQHLMSHEHTNEALAMMRAIKKTLDPNGILNPGKLALG